MILELRRFWSYHPRYKDIVDNIQGKYSFEQRPQYGIVLKTSSANHVQFSADQFQGTVESHVFKAGVGNSPGLSVEWVQEDAVAIQNNDGHFPSPPGIYYIEVVEADPTPPYSKEPSYQFYVDPLLEVQDESLIKSGPFTWQTQNPFLTGTLRLYQMPGSIELVEGINYTASPGTGEVTVTNPLNAREWLSADYRYPAPTTGPWGIKENFANKDAIPGVTMVFGRRIEKDDRLAIVVHDRRQPTAEEFGGKWEINVDFDVIASDVQSQQEISDATIMYLWGVARNRLSTEGIEITQVSFGGETEEVRDETGDDYYYNASFSVTLLTDWAIHVPIAQVIRKVTPQTQAQIDASAAMTEDEIAEYGSPTSIYMLESLGLRLIQDPYFVTSGRIQPFAVIR